MMSAEESFDTLIDIKDRCLLLGIGQRMIGDLTYTVGGVQVYNLQSAPTAWSSKIRRSTFTYSQRFSHMHTLYAASGQQAAQAKPVYRGWGNTAQANAPTNLSSDQATEVYMPDTWTSICPQSQISRVANIYNFLLLKAACRAPIMDAGKVRKFAVRWGLIDLVQE
jgi:hypothetical protein